MRILSWNCRGLGNPFAILQCQQEARDYKPDFMILMETKLVQGKGRDIWNRCGFIDGWEVPRVGLSGGLFLAWMPRQSVSIIF